MKPTRSNRRLPLLHMTADEFDRLQAVADRQGVNMALYAKRAVMRAVSRAETFATLSTVAKHRALGLTHCNPPRRAACRFCL